MGNNQSQDGTGKCHWSSLLHTHSERRKYKEIEIGQAVCSKQLLTVSRSGAKFHKENANSMSEFAHPF